MVMVMGRTKKGLIDPVGAILCLKLGTGVGTENEVGTGTERAAGKQMEVRGNGDAVVGRNPKLSL